MPENKATYSQDCRYCSQPAMASLTYGDKAADFMPVCWGHEEMARNEIKKLGMGVVDMVAIDNTGVNGMRGSSLYRIPRNEALLARALEPAPVYPAATAESRYGLRVDPRRAAAAFAVVEADAPPAPGKAVPSKVEPNRDEPKAFLQALGSDWRNLRASRINNNRLTVSIDSMRFTLYTRKG